MGRRALERKHAQPEHRAPAHLRSLKARAYHNNYGLWKAFESQTDLIVQLGLHETILNWLKGPDILFQHLSSIDGKSRC